MDPKATNYNSNATAPAQCTYPPVLGCMDPHATNYNSAATKDDGSCTYPPVLGCMDSKANNYNPAATKDDGSCTYPIAPVLGCMDPKATNYNPAATKDDGSCKYQPAPILGCTDPKATNYNKNATKDDGSCTYPPASVPGCTDPKAVNYNPAATANDGSCTYGGGSGPAAPSCTLTASPTSVSSGAAATLSWTTSSATSFSISTGIGAVTPVASGATTTKALSANTTFTGTATGAGGTASCTATVSITTTGGGGGGGAGGGPVPTGGGGGGGGANSLPTIVVTALPHVGAQPLAYLYLSQIPYTGLDLGPVGTTVYWIVLLGLSVVLTYLVLFVMIPVINRSARAFGSRVSAVLNAPKPEPAPAPVKPPRPATPFSAAVSASVHEAPRAYSPYEGFRSFAHKEALSIEDIVKGLSRQPIAERVPSHAEPAPRVEPIYEHVEPIASAVILEEMKKKEEEAPIGTVPADIRGFATALLEGDREAVFAGLRQQVRGAGAPEQLVSQVACLLDDVYRARIDGSECDAALARVAARLDTPTLEKLVASLATAIDSSYSSGITGAKLALTRALSALGA